MTEAARRPAAASAIAFAIAAAVAIAFFAPVIFHGRLLALGDALNEALPAFLAPNERWQPSMLLGFPIYADASKAFWNPLRLLRYASGGFDAYMLATYAIASWAVFGYLRTITGSILSGVIGAAIFTYGGFMISHVGHPMIAQPAAWSCVAVWSLELFLRTQQGRWLAAMAAAEVLSFLAGQPQIAAFGVGSLFAYLFINGFRGRSMRTLWNYCEGLAAIVLGALVTSFATIPALILGSSSVRSGLTFDAFVNDKLPLAHLAQMLFYPFAIGGGSHQYGSLVQAQPGLFTEATCYVGAAALVLAALAPLSQQRRLGIFWCSVAVAGLALALGDALPLAAWAYQVPGFGLFRIPGRHAYEFTLSVAICAGIGISAFLRPQIQARAGHVVLLTALCACIAGFALATVDVRGAGADLRAPAIATFAAAFAIQLLCLLLASFAALKPAYRAGFASAAVLAGLIPFAQNAYWRDAPDRSILDRPAYARILDQLPIGPGQRVYTDFANGLVALEPNLPTIWGVPDIGGYTPLQFPANHVLLQTGIEGRLLNPTSRMIDLASVRYVAVPQHDDVTRPAAAPYDPANLNAFLSNGRVEAARSITYGISAPASAERLSMITALGASLDVPQGVTVATVTLRSAAGRTESIPLRAGVETAEFGYERPENLGRVRHRQAAIYDHSGSYAWYQCSIPIHLAAPVVSIGLRVNDRSAALNVRKISFIDDSSQRAYPVSEDMQYRAEPHHFRFVIAAGGVTIYENLRARRAAWIGRPIRLVKAPASEQSFVTLREAIFALPSSDEVFVSSDAAASSGATPAGTVAITTLEAERRVLDVSCTATCLLVSSATFDGGWNAMIDDRPAPIFAADGMFEGLFVPPGHHIVRYCYAPPFDLAGKLLSLAATLVLAAWLIARRRRKGREANAARL